MPAGKPDDDEIEISVFAKGIGECVVVHCGAGHWIIVDSLKDDNKNPAALSYLDSIAVSADQIALVALTHWHDDHVRGAAQVVKSATNAKIALPASLCRDEFQALIGHHSKIVAGSFSTGVDELIGVLTALQGRKADRIFANANTVLYENPTVRVDALSPSHEDLEQFILAIDAWARHGPSDKRLSKPHRNDTSVAVSVKVEDCVVLLGADLEVRGKLSGWQAVHEIAWGGRDKACLFKIPHHGSENAHYDAVWKDMLLENVSAVLTPFNKGRKKLPSSDDVNRICSLTNSAYAASATASRRAERQHNSVERTLNEAGIELYRDPMVSWVRFRKKFVETAWRVEISGTGHLLTSNAA